MLKRSKVQRKQQRQRRRNIARRLLAYSAAAGGSMLAVGQADGAIVYNDIPDRLVKQPGFVGQDSFLIDMNSDGANDLLFQHFYFGGSKATARLLPQNNVHGQSFTKTDNFSGLAMHRMARAGDLIDSALGMTSTFAYASYQYVSGGPNYASQSHPAGRRWMSAYAGSVGEGYIPLRFQAADGTHYGWIRMQIELNNSPTLSNVASDLPAAWAAEFPTPSATGTASAGQMRIFDLAYESLPNVPLLAGDAGPVPEAVPEPASLGLLALGAAGLGALALRRRKGQ